VYVLQTIAEQIGLPPILKAVFPTDYRTLLALAFFEISEAAPLYLFPYWVESSAVAEVSPLSSRDLTTFTQNLGRMERERLEFSRQWVKQAGPIHAVAFDITSLSSYSELVEYVEWGYNRDLDSLPQINLGIIYAENTQLPLHYQVYPGSIPDVSTLQNMLHYLELFELHDLIFIADRGFYSAANLAKLHHAPVTFILPLPRSVKQFASLLSKHKRPLTNPANAFPYHDEVLFHVYDTFELNQVSLYAHLFFSEHRKSEQTSRFLNSILELETAAHQETFRTPQEARSYLARHLKGASRLFHVQTRDGRVEIARKPQTLARRMGKMGVTIMLSNSQDIQRSTMLDLYRRKDYLEKTFDVLKNECDGKRLRGHSKEAVEGCLFIKFLSLILYAALGNTMRQQQLFKDYSVKELMYELKKLRIVELSNGKSYLTEISKRQKDIFSKFAIDIPSIKTELLKQTILGLLQGKLRQVTTWELTDLLLI
jgi:transposase